MPISNSKRNFIFGKSSRTLPLRPPWSESEQSFIDTCTRCDACIDECHLNVIKKADGGFPAMDFTHSGCDFCQVCVDVCESNALKRDQSPAFALFASISDECFSARGVICRSCGDICDRRAIEFKQKPGGISELMMKTSACNGCGECVSICPANAISMKHRDPTGASV